jgi:hypothetical protein
MRCPKMETLVLHIKSDPSRVGHLISMVKSRASGGARLFSITVFNPGRNVSRTEVLELREHVTHVRYTVEDMKVAWDDSGGESE